MLHGKVARPCASWATAFYGNQFRQFVHFQHFGNCTFEASRKRCASTVAAQTGRAASWQHAVKQHNGKKFTKLRKEQSDGRRSVKLSSPRHSSKPAVFKYFATCHPGLEQVVAQELASPLIGADDIEVGKAGVSFSGRDMGVGMRANLWLRCAIRVLLLMAEGSLSGGTRRRGGDELYDFTRTAVDWPQLLSRKQTFSVVAHLGAGITDINNSQFAATMVKDAICDAMRDARGFKPDAPGEEGPDLPLHITIHHDEVLLYRSMCGTSLHRRGYRDVMHRASLNEAAAAGMLMMAEWPQIAQQPGAVLVDPMCGSGTILIEAVLMARNIAPGVFRRRWPFLQWPDTDRQLWSSCREAAEAAEQKWQGRIFGNDIHPGALSLAEKDIRQALGPTAPIQLSNKDCGAWRPATPPTLVVTNPPWGHRLMPGSDSRGMESRTMGNGSRGRDGAMGGRMGSQPAPLPHSDAIDAWASLSECLKGGCAGATAFVLCGNSHLTKELRMKAARKYPVMIGGVDTRLLKYEVYPQQQPSGQQ